VLLKSYMNLRSAGALIAGGLLMLHAGSGSGTSRAVDQINAMSRAPIPTVGPRKVVRPDSVWVPDRWIPAPATGGAALVPGHWERRLSEHESYVPPLTAVNPADGSQTVYPAGVRPRAEERREP
jgi:hypothetical protein